MTASVVYQGSTFPQRLAGGLLLVAGLLSIAIALFLGMQGFRVSETFGIKDIKQIQDGMHLYRLDLKSWPEPPFRIIDDARYGTRGTLTQLQVDGVPIQRGRASRPVLLDPATAAYVHTGVGNLYLTPGPTADVNSRFEVTYTIRLDPALWIGALIVGVAVMLSGGFLILGFGLLFDAMLVVLTLAAAAGAWLNVTGVQLDRPIMVSEARKLAPHGYLSWVPRLGPLSIPATDRGTPIINGHLLIGGRAVGDPFALGKEISENGDGAHLMASRGAFYFSLPGNPADISDVDDVAVRATYVLPGLHLALLTIGWGLVLAAGLTGGRSTVLRKARLPRPRFAAIALPAAMVSITGGYLAWLLSADPLHMFGPPGEKDWFTSNEGWRMAGLVRTYPYQGIIVGTSVSQNFYMAEASAVLGMPVLNASIAGSVPSGHADLVRLALRQDRTDLIIWEINLTGFLQPTTLSRPELAPDYLYDRNPLNDAEYYFSLQAFNDTVEARRARDAGKLESLDPINKWGERMDFGPSVIARHYCERRDIKASAADLNALAENLRTHVVPLAEAHPETRFNLFIPAYPALMHLPVGGRMTGLEKAARVMLETLGDLPNVEVHDFQGIGPELGDPRLFRDDIHYHPSINSRILREMAAGTAMVTPSGLDAHETRLRETFTRTGEAFREAMAPVCESSDG